MLNDIPYSVLKKDQRAYEILILRDQHQNTFEDIANEYNVSKNRVIALYNRIKVKQIRLYVNHISIALGHEDTAIIRADFDAAFDSYREFQYICAFLEKKYKKILDEYRSGEPGLPAQFIEGLPPLKPELSKDEIARIVEMREKEKQTFIKIGIEMRITPEKAKHEYHTFYKEPVFEYIAALQNEAKSYEEKQAIWNRFFRPYRSARKMYEMMLAEKEKKK